MNLKATKLKMETFRQKYEYYKMFSLSNSVIVTTR